LQALKEMLFGIKGKFFFISTLSIVMCAVAVFWVSLNEHENIYLESVEDNIEALAENVADELLLLLVDEADAFELKNQLLIFEKYHHIILATVYDEYWQEIDQYIKPNDSFTKQNIERLGRLTQPQSLPLGITPLNDVLMAVYPIGEPVDPIGYLHVIHDFKTPIEKSRDALFTFALPLVLLVLFISLCLTWFLFNRLFAPLIELSDFTRLIGRTRDYSLRVNPKGSDEIANLSQDINSMLETINKENRLNKQQNDILQAQQNSMYQLANYDQLTNLPNRRHILAFLASHLRTAQKQQREVAVLYFDVDSFKSVNDRMGHETGDKLLVKISDEIKSCLRPSDLLARLAGDEFLVVLIEEVDLDLAQKISARIVARLKRPLMVGKWEIFTGVSIGACLGSQAKYDVDSLISNADIAMYASKKKGRGLSTLFQPNMLSDNRRKLKIVDLIPLALEHEEFSLVYQPKISSEGHVNALEALIRWNSAELGVISPAEFIPIAESGGRIWEITQWLITHVIRDIDKLNEICGVDMVVSINVSSKDVLNPELETHILSTLKQYNQSITSLQFEITESSYLEEFDTANDFFSSIRQLGGSIALDDFGTGYSSLCYLTRIEIDTLKIDRQFVSNAFNSAKDATVLTAIIELANQMDLHSCCEGIETPADAVYLIGLGCNSLQGYYFSHPVALDNLAAAVAEAQAKFQALCSLTQLENYS
jgi:diguanylate cyclase (GGDEF)-like protein